MLRHTFLPVALMAAFAVSLITSPAQAQVGVALLYATQPSEKDFSLSSDNYFFADGTVDRGPGSRDFDLNIYQIRGWGKLRPGEANSPAVGVRMDYFDLSGSSTLLPRQMADIAVGLGGNVGQWEDWKIDMVAGIGYAGTAPFKDGDAVYAMGDIVATKPLDERTQLSLLLSYNGNRSILPDVPLPAIAWTRQVDEQLLVTLGFPFSSVTWRPADRVTVTAAYTLPFSIDVRGEYELTDEFTLYGAFENHFDAFTPHRGAEHRRIFFQQRRLEAGVEWEPCEMMQLSVGVGYAFGGEFSTGWDARDDNTLLEVSDEAYIRAGLSFAF